MPIHVKRTTTILNPDQTRVLLRPFNPGDPQRARGIVTRIMALPEQEIGPLLDDVCAEFCGRHKDIRQVFLDRFGEIDECLAGDDRISTQRKLLIGSDFLAEYSFRAAS